jgi:hypothetical protein
MGAKVKPPTEPGFYIAKSKQGNWYTVLVTADGDYCYTSEIYGIENMPKKITDFVEWVKV